MRCLTPSLLRRFWGLLPQYLSVGPSQSPNLSPKQSSLRQSCSARPGLLTAPDVVSYWQKVFEKNGIPEARESSEYIVSFVLGAKTFQSLDSEKLRAPLTAVQQEQIQQLSCKRLERMPVQYVLGEWDFQNLTLKMRPPVFIPRPETEIKTMMHAGRNGTCYSSADSTVISGQALETELLFPFKGDPQDLISLVVEEESRKCEVKNSAFSVAVPPPVILEIGCGSGAIALSLLCKIPQSRVLAVDKEEAAVDLTRENVHRLQLQGRIHVLHHNVSYGSAKHLLPWGPMDFIVSNPPYVFHEDMASLDAEILRYEDLDALDGGDDGMRVIKTILTLAPTLLKDSGSVFLEVDPRHPAMVEDWLTAQPDLFLTLRAVHKDFCGKPRFLHIQKQSR